MPKISSLQVGVFVLAATVLTGCGGGIGTIFKEFELDGGKSITTGARQRVITNIEPGVASRPGRVDPQRIVCVEPSPDVAVAVANAFGASVGILGQGSGSISGTQIEGVAQLAERTTSVQAILKQGYQACLDYANGAITSTTYSLRQSRLDDLLVTLILSEHVSGAFGRSGAAIGTKASAEARASIAGLAAGKDEIDKLQGELAEADKEVVKERKELDEAEKALTKAETENKDAKEIEILKEKRDAEKAQLVAAEAKRDVLLARLRASSDTLAKASGEVTKVVGIGGITADLDEQQAKIIGEMHARFVDKNVNQAVISSCLTELGLWMLPDPAIDPAFQTFALGRLTSLTGSEAISREGMLAFFLARQIGAKNELTEFCRKNLKGLVEISFANRHEIRLKELDLEDKRLDIRRRDFERQISKAAAIHPIASFNALKEAASALTKLKDTLTAKPIPQASKEKFPQAKRDKMITEQKNLSGEALALLKRAGDATDEIEMKAVTTLEDRFIALIGDTRQSGATTQRKRWKADSDGQQADAEEKDVALKKILKKIEELSGEINDLLTRISRVS